MSECDKSPTGQHDAFLTGQSQSACMYGPNKGSNTVRCSWCGRYGHERWHEEERHIDGHGPFATRLVRVIDDTLWPNPGVPDA